MECRGLALLTDIDDPALQAHSRYVVLRIYMNSGVHCAQLTLSRVFRMLSIILSAHFTSASRNM
jgi:hypothetical protein